MGFCFARASIPPCASSARYAGSWAIPTASTPRRLANPARARHELVGVNDPAMAVIMAAVLGSTAVSGPWWSTLTTAWTS